jgi:hypothetical protein
MISVTIDITYVARLFHMATLVAYFIGLYYPMKAVINCGVSPWYVIPANFWNLRQNMT